jgi:hypothetical protein
MSVVKVDQGWLSQRAGDDRAVDVNLILLTAIVNAAIEGCCKMATAKVVLCEISAENF